MLLTEDSFGCGHPFALLNYVDMCSLHGCGECRNGAAWQLTPDKIPKNHIFWIKILADRCGRAAVSDTQLPPQHLRRRTATEQGKLERCALSIQQWERLCLSCKLRSSARPTLHWRTFQHCSRNLPPTICRALSFVFGLQSANPPRGGLNYS